MLAWFLSGDVSRYVNDAGVVSESKTVIQQQRNVERRETFISDVFPFRFADRHQRVLVRLKHTVAPKRARYYDSQCNMTEKHGHVDIKDDEFDVSCMSQL